MYLSNQIYGSSFIEQHSETLLWFEIAKMLIVVLKSIFIVSFITIFGTFSFAIQREGSSTPTANNAPSLIPRK